MTAQAQTTKDSKPLTVREVANRLDRVVESTNAAIGGINEKFDTILRAINNPVAIRKETVAEDLGPDPVVEFKETRGGPELELTRPSDIESPRMQEKLEALAFMSEMVEIHIAETSERDADQVFSIGVNGKQTVFRRGQSYTVPRYIVEGLARAKPVHFENQEYTDNDGTRKVRYPSRRGLRYPFSVLKDSARGEAWLKGVLRQP